MGYIQIKKVTEHHGPMFEKCRRQAIQHLVHRIVKPKLEKGEIKIQERSTTCQ